jgi:hypothetical protein
LKFTNKGLSHKVKKTLARKLAEPGESLFTSKGWLERKAKIAARVAKAEKRVAE